MCWMFVPSLSQTQRVLHIRHKADEPWQPYTDFPHLVKPNPDNLGNPGWTTYQSLRALNYTLLKGNDD